LVDDLDDDRQVLGEAEEPRGVEMGVGAEAFDAAQDRPAGDAPVPEPLHDTLVERLTRLVVGLADVDAELEGGSIDAHPPFLTAPLRPSARPAQRSRRALT